MLWEYKFHGWSTDLIREQQGNSLNDFLIYGQVDKPEIGTVGRQREAWLVKPPTRKEQQEQGSRIGERNQIWEKRTKKCAEIGRAHV